MVNIIEIDDFLDIDSKPEQTYRIFRICSDKLFKTKNETIDIDGIYILDVYDTEYNKDEILRIFLKDLKSGRYKGYSYSRDEYTQSDDSACRKIREIERDYILSKII